MTAAVRIAHVSDLHVFAPAEVELRRLLCNKCLTGHANLLFKRGRAYAIGAVVSNVNMAPSITR